MTVTERAEIRQKLSSGNKHVTVQLTAPSQRETPEHLLKEEGVFQSTQTVSHEALTAKLITASLNPVSNSLLCRTFWATLTISCVRVRDFPVKLAAFFVESLQDLPHFVVPTSTTQFQVLPVQLQCGACILYAVVGFPLDVEVCGAERHNKEGNQEWLVMIPMVAFQLVSISLHCGYWELRGLSPQRFTAKTQTRI